MCLTLGFTRERVDDPERGLIAAKREPDRRASLLVCQINRASEELRHFGTGLRLRRELDDKGKRDAHGNEARPEADPHGRDPAISDTGDRIIHRVIRTACHTPGSARPVSDGRVDESFSVAQADVDGEVGEDLRHLGAVSELHGRPGSGTVEHAHFVMRHDAS